MSGVPRAASPSLTSFPASYQDAIGQMREATKQAITEGHLLMEIEIPTAGLYSVAGDAEGGNEMTLGMEYLHRFCRIFELMGISENVKIFFPEKKELKLARESGEFGTKMKMDYLMMPTVLMDIGIDVNKRPVIEKIESTDKVLVIGYPHFNVEEILYVEELWRDLKKSEMELPIVVFNGKIAKSFIPQFCQTYYIHNFKGQFPGALFRCYPEQWQILKRDHQNLSDLTLVATSDTMPSLKDISLKILPNH